MLLSSMLPSTNNKSCDHMILTLILTWVLLIHHVHASWWYLGLASTAYQSTLDSPTLNYRRKCLEIDVFAPRQRELCVKTENVLDVVADGAELGIVECQHQFSTRRWNCTTNNDTDVFGNVLSLRSREQAYIYSISSAGVMHSLIKSCAKGELGMCGCDTNIRSRDTRGKFVWGGCSHDIDYGQRFAKDFIDSKEDRMDPVGLMNIWNNGAGRKAVKSNMKLICKCHGVSGSCSVKICWRAMSSFRQVGAYLKDKFDGASRVETKKRSVRLRPVDNAMKEPTRKDLVYLEESPDFCEYSADVGSLGTRDRQCNKTSYGLDGCTLMCCGRGYYTLVRDKVEECDCKFFWCCRVECQKCRSRVEEYFCN